MDSDELPLPVRTVSRGAEPPHTRAQCGEAGGTLSAIHRTAAWGRFTRRVRPMIAATLPSPCIDPKPGCAGLVLPGDRWDVAHIVSHHLDPMQPMTPEAVGPAHAACNRWHGAKEGRAKQLRAKRDDQRLPGADSGW